MKARIYFTLLLTTVFLGSQKSFAGIINIPADYIYIQQGIDRATVGDTILVQPGVYFENINYYGKDVVVASLYLITGDTSYITQTVINGNNNIALVDGSVATFENAETSSAQLTGFTLTAGTGDARYLGFQLINYGGGIFCKNASPTFSHLIITGNNSECGGGICLYNSNSLIENCTISHDTCISMEFSAPDAGGGIVFWNCLNPRLINSLVVNNVVDYVGAGIYFLNSSPVIVNCLIANNNAYAFASTLYLDTYSSVNIINSTIVANISDTTASNSSMIYCLDSTFLNISNSIIWDNQPAKIVFQATYPPNTITVSHTDIEGDTASIITNGNGTIIWLSGNINSNPQFIDTALSNFRLQNTSPCIDTGDTIGLSNTIPIFDLDNNNRFIGAIDIGCYENQTPLNIYQTESNNQIIYVSPNPCHASLTVIGSQNEHYEIILYDILSEKLTQQGFSNSTALNTEQFANGIYIYELRNKNGTITTGKVIKQ